MTKLFLQEPKTPESLEKLLRESPEVPPTLFSKFLEKDCSTVRCYDIRAGQVAVTGPHVR